MSGIVLEGGTFRPIFSCGIMDCLNDHDIMFDYCIGVSAGITDGVSYVSKQPRRNLEILKRIVMILVILVLETIRRIILYLV